MTNLHTDPALLEALRNSTSRSLSQVQIERQRLSFVMGSLPEDNRMTREEVQRVLARHEGQAIAAR